MGKEVKITGISSLIDDLKNVYDDLRNGKIKLRDAKQVANTANTLIRAAAQKQSYNDYMDKKDKINFLED